MGFFACELHCHTLHSDGDFQPRELQRAATAEELQLIALTDHNTKTGTAELAESICPFISGIEWTTYFGHMLVLGGNTYVDWRDAVPGNIDEKTALLQQSGAAVGVAHPFQLGSPMCTGGRWQFDVQNWENIDYIEVFHESFLPTDENKRAYELWHKLLSAGHHLGATYGRDWHRPQKNAAPCGCTYIEADCAAITPAAALSAIKRGRTVPSVGPELQFCAVQGGHTYAPGETAHSGQALIKCTADLTKRRRFWAGFSIEFTKIRIQTNACKTLCTLPPSGGEESVVLNEHSYYTAELWGKIGGETALLAAVSPIYSA